MKNRKPALKRLEHYVIFDDMNWPLPDTDLAWRLRYGNPTREDLLRSASILSAYYALIDHSQKRRNYIASVIKENR
jgi:hypothetical protein